MNGDLGTRDEAGCPDGVLKSREVGNRIIAPLPPSSRRSRRGSANPVFGQLRRPSGERARKRWEDKVHLGTETKIITRMRVRALTLIVLVVAWMMPVGGSSCPSTATVP